MSGLSAEQLEEQERCIEKQRVFLDKLLEFMDWAPRMERRIIEAEKIVDEHNRKLAAVDKRLTDDIEDLRKMVKDQFGAVMDINKKQNETLSNIQDSISKIEPYLEYAKPLTEGWEKWRPRVIWAGLASMVWVVISILSPHESHDILLKILEKLVG
jgi:hypothetical protein